MASKFLEHFVQIADAMNRLGGSGLWHDEDGFYYDQPPVPPGYSLAPPSGARPELHARRERVPLALRNSVPIQVDFDPGESSTPLFGGNSNWRGPIWFPVNYLLIEALERYHHFYGDTFQIQCPTGSSRIMNLQQVANELGARLASIFLPDATGRRPCHGDDARFVSDPHWRDLVLFHEYFHGETGRGLGANHQTGWTALVIRYIADLARQRGGTV